MRFIRVDDDAPTDVIEAAIRSLRQRQIQCVLIQTMFDIGDDIDELLDMLSARLAGGS